jgi:hypothetical protein
MPRLYLRDVRRSLLLRDQCRGEPVNPWRRPERRRIGQHLLCADEYRAALTPAAVEGRFEADVDASPLKPGDGGLSASKVLRVGEVHVGVLDGIASGVA